MATPNNPRPADRTAGSETALNGLLTRCDEYLHAVPLTGATAAEVGPFTLFLSTTAWPYYARPTPGRADRITTADVHRLARRCAELSAPRALEWVVQRAPRLGQECAAAGWTVTEHPLLAVQPDRFVPAPAPDGVAVGVVPPERAAFAAVWAVVRVAFGSPGTSVGAAGAAARDEELRGVRTRMIEALVDRTLRGVAVTAAVVPSGGGGPLAVGQHQPVGSATEVVAVATLPAERRRGLAAAVTTALVEDAFARGVDLVLLSAADDAVARVYERLGFRRIGSVGAAQAP